MQNRESIILKLRKQLDIGRKLIGVSCGSGLAAKHASRGGADFILALNSGWFRQAGLGALAGYLPFSNCNQMVMEFGSKEMIPLVKDTPILFGLCATDPTLDMASYIDRVAYKGFHGVNNYPTVGMIDGNFRDSLEAQGMGFALEIEALRMAHQKDMFTVAFVFNKEQAEQMLQAGADVICSHLGLTSGGILGAKKVLSLESGAQVTREIFAVCEEQRPEVIKMVYGGPVSTTIDVKYMYDNTNADGYIGGSTFERIPSERAIASTTQEFKTTGLEEGDELHSKMLAGIGKHYDYVTFVKEYVEEHYQTDIIFADLAKVAHVSRSHLSTLFSKELGCTFPDYLANYRINRAKEIYKIEGRNWTEIAFMVGFKDYSYFSRTFKKQTGLSPRAYAREKQKK